MRHEPVVLKRRCGGYLARTPRGYRICMGVAADTACNARIKYYQSLRAWLRTLNNPVKR